MERRLAPQVTADTLDGERAYLLGWERLPAGDGSGWGARICWVELTDEGAWLVRGGVVPADTVHQIAGQDYTHVPRDPTPSDPSDPRDPKSQKYGRDKAYFEALHRRNQPPNENPKRHQQMDGPF